MALAVTPAAPAGLAVALLAPRLAWADHSGRVGRAAGSTDIWLLAAAVLAVIAAVAWALFAPGGGDEGE